MPGMYAWYFASLANDIVFLSFCRGPFLCVSRLNSSGLILVPKISVECRILEGVCISSCTNSVVALQKPTKIRHQLNVCGAMSIQLSYNDRKHTILHVFGNAEYALYCCYCWHWPCLGETNKRRLYPIILLKTMRFSVKINYGHNLTKSGRMYVDRMQIIWGEIMWQISRGNNSRLGYLNWYTFIDDSLDIWRKSIKNARHIAHEFDMHSEQRKTQK